MLLPSSVSNQKLESQLFSPHVKARINWRSTVQILQKWGSCMLAPLRYIKNPSHCMSCLFSSLHRGGGALFLPTSRDIFSREKNSAAVTLDVIAERKEICLAIHISYEVFVWKMKTPKTSARFSPGNEFIPHFSLTSDSFSFLLCCVFSSLVDIFFWLICLSLFCVFFVSLTCCARLSCVYVVVLYSPVDSNQWLWSFVCKR